jgi:hypothetical protein
MAELPHFQENGRFSAARYRAMDNSTRMSLRRQVQENAAVDMYISDVTGVKSSSSEASFISSMASPRRSFDVAIFPLSSYPDSELINYATANPEFFKIIHLSRITVYTSEREARQLQESIRNGSISFSEAAIAHSQDWAADRGGELGETMAFELEYENLPVQARESIMSLAKGELSDVYSTPHSGWIFFQVDEAARTSDFSDSFQIHKVRNYVMQNFRGIAEDWVIAEAERFSTHVREIGFDAAVYVGGHQRNSFGPIPLNYGNIPLFSSISTAGVPELSGAGENQLFWQTAFSTPLNTPSRAIVAGDNVVVLFPLEQLDMDEEEKNFVITYFPYWMDGSSGDSYRSYFINNEKLDNRFQETFWNIWGTN